MVLVGKSRKIPIAIAGVGNCASALVQGIAACSKPDGNLDGVITPEICGYRPGDISVVAAFDVDARKVGRPLEEAIFASPNCCMTFAQPEPSGVVVRMAPPIDGVAPHMAAHPESRAFRLAEDEPASISEELRRSNAQILVCFLPVGAEQAAKHFAQACLEAGVALVNCIPVFIASDPEWAGRFRQAGLPLIGDDVKSQVGATIVHRAMARLFSDRGYTLRRTYQINTGGNTDFLNMTDPVRLQSKKISKTQAVSSQVISGIADEDIHIGPSDYIPWQRDNKVAFIRMEATGFGGAPLELEMRLSVQDSPNSAGVVVDAIRCARVALDRGIAGPVEPPSAYFMKSPPVQMTDDDALRGLRAFVNAAPAT